MWVFSLLAGGVPCLMRTTLTPSIALEALCQLCELWKNRYFSIVLLCTINAICWQRILHNRSNFITIISNQLKLIKEFILKAPSHFTAKDTNINQFFKDTEEFLWHSQMLKACFRPVSLLQNYYPSWSHRNFSYFRTSKWLWKLTHSCQHASDSIQGLSLLPPLCLSAETHDGYECYWQLR